MGADGLVFLLGACRSYANRSQDVVASWHMAVADIKAVSLNSFKWDRYSSYLLVLDYRKASVEAQNCQEHACTAGSNSRNGNK